jgi:tetratricopeptide (TPR) repeat protein
MEERRRGMKNHVIGVAAAGLALALISWKCPARADTTVIGGGFAEDCSKSAKAVAVNRPAHVDALNECTLAIQNEVLGIHDLASTYVNRGVIYMAGRQYDAALKDFDSALMIERELPEAFVNRGAALIGMGRDADGIAEINRGLALNPTDPERAYYNRALAEENLNDLKGAYYDYKKALELKPDWEMAKTQLARFTVVQK